MRLESWRQGTRAGLLEQHDDKHLDGDFGQLNRGRQPPYDGLPSPSPQSVAPSPIAPSPSPQVRRPKSVAPSPSHRASPSVQPSVEPSVQPMGWRPLAQNDEHRRTWKSIVRGRRKAREQSNRPRTAPLSPLFSPPTLLRISSNLYRQQVEFWYASANIPATFSRTNVRFAGTARST